VRAVAVRRRTLLPALVVLLLPLLLGSTTRAPEPARTAPAAAAAADRTAQTYAAAAAALRGRDCGRALATLQPLAQGASTDATFARLVSGLYAHACEDVALAEERLFAAPSPGGPLEDWRLYVLSDSAAAHGHVLLGQAALAKLLGDYPASPLRPQALAKAAALAWERGDARRALDLIDRGRREGIAGEPAVRLEALAWEIAGAQGDRERRATAARRLLTDYPEKAAELQVADVFRAQDGTLDWSAILPPAELRRRAAALLAMGLADSALETLQSAPRRDRDLAWALAAAEIMTADRRGGDALNLLADYRPTAPRERVELEWARARAALDAAKAQRGRKNLASTERRRLRGEARRHLEQVVHLGVDRDRSVQSLRLLYEDLAEDEEVDAAIDVLRRLRRLDATDTTGADDLWRLGWRAYRGDNYTGAIGTWTELTTLYPRAPAARRGRYWTARAFAQLGEHERAAQIYAEVAAADTTDFYRKNALARVKTPVRPEAIGAAEPWPQEASLQHARLLTDLGLDDLALSELEIVRGKAQPRAYHATEALILANRGERRTSIQVISKAFPELGGAYQAALPEAARRLYYPLDYQDPVNRWARANGLPLPLVYGMIRQESAFDANAVSWAGAQGLMQLMPGTARELAQKLGLPYSRQQLADPAYNVQLGTTYFRKVLGIFDGNTELALAGYNGGPYRIKRLWRESGGGELDRFLEGLDLEESKTYVKRILVHADSYRQLYPEAG
jgi:soluble lytic murein transglycosylase-like protein